MYRRTYLRCPGKAGFKKLGRKHTCVLQIVSATNLPQKEAEQKPRRKNIFNIPCKVEFYNARGEKSEVGQMEFSDKGFQARGKNNNEVIYSLPRKPQVLYSWRFKF